MIERGITFGPPTSEEARIMAEGEYRDIRKTYGWFAGFRRGWEVLKRVVGGLKDVMPRGKERLL